LAFGGMMAVAFKRLRPLFRQRNEINAEVTGRLGEALGGIRTVKVYTAEEREERIFADGIERLFRNVASTITGTSAVGAATTVIVGVIGVLMIIVGGRSIVGGSMTLGGFVMYIFFIGLVAAPLVQIASIGTQVSEAFAGLDRIREIRQTATEDQEDEHRDAVREIAGDVAFQNVSFEYVPGVPVLRDVSFQTAAGTTTALVGSSGAGKSTLIGLVSAFNRPTHGRVLVDGRDAASLRLREYRAHLGVVMQDNFLFDGTIKDNIAFAKPNATDEEVRAVSRIAHCDEFIERFEKKYDTIVGERGVKLSGGQRQRVAFAKPNATDEEVRAVSRIAHCDEFIERFEKKYDTIVGERGVKLSGGQRQRVAIARAILADPRILILDEATSSLDSESEALIRDGLRSLRRGRTTFVIAHRLSTIESADQILVMEEGRIIERGTHRELLAANGRYRQLYDKQYNIEHDQFINPGEDFLPVPEPEPAPVRAARQTRGAL